MKVISFYLPQFHAIPENDKWWGKGFTEWVNVKKATALFEGHNQPRIPLDNNYYNLLNVDIMRWQTKIAEEHGIYGFAFYHYWFDGHMLLEKPMELLLKHKEIDFPFCISWANEHWTNAWVSKENNILIEQRYGGKSEWKEHFLYLLKFFQDERYIKHDEKPLFILYRPELIEKLNDMLDYWQELALENGLKGICFAFQHVGLDLLENKDDSRFTFNIEYQPMYALAFKNRSKLKLLKEIKGKLFLFLEKRLPTLFEKLPNRGLVKHDYDEVWNYLIKAKPISKKSVPGIFVDYDNTPRRGKQGTIFVGVAVEKFKKYFKQYVVHIKAEYKSDYIFAFAWNEWAEGGYLEPDEKNKFKYLDAIKDVLIELDELPKNDKH